MSEEKLQDLEKLSAHLAEREKALDAREKALGEIEKALQAKGVRVEAREQNKPLTKAQEKLIAEGCKAYGVDRKFLFSSGIDPHTGEAVILTHGGKKLRHKKGHKAKFELTETQITGNLPEQELVWSEKFNQKIDLLRLFKKRKKG